MLCLGQSSWWQLLLQEQPWEWPGEMLWQWDGCGLLLTWKAVRDSQCWCGGESDWQVTPEVDALDLVDWHLCTLLQYIWQFESQWWDYSLANQPIWLYSCPCNHKGCREVMDCTALTRARIIVRFIIWTMGRWVWRGCSIYHTRWKNLWNDKSYWICHHNNHFSWVD